MGSLNIQSEYVAKPYEVVNSTGTGATVLLTCTALSEVIPAAGILLTNFSDQNNPIQVSQQQLADAAVGPNGNMSTWTTPNYVDVSVGIMANSIDDFLLWGCGIAVRKKAGLSALGTPPPLWDMVVTYPNALGQSRVFRNGIMLTGDLGASMATNARINGKAYTFRFIGADLSEGTGGFNV